VEWINPKYADVMKALRGAQQARQDSRERDTRPVRGFILPAPPDAR
jgi:hypothetical protein